MGLKRIWDSVNQRCDWALTATGIASGNDLESNILKRLFTDRVAESSWVDPGGGTDRRGSWMDAYRAEPYGSRLWQLWLLPIQSTTGFEARARDIVAEALQPMIDLGIVASFEIVCTLQNSRSLAITIDAFEPMTNAKSSFGYMWNGY